MADLAARREARRRKILENSKNRLKLITGELEELKDDTNLNVNNCTNSEHKLVENKETEENNEINAINFLLDAQKRFNEEPTIGIDALLSNNLINDVSALNENDNLQPEVSSTSISVNSSYISPYSKKIFIIALAIIIRLLFIFQMQFCLRDSIILPFIIAEITIQIVNRDSSSNSSTLINAALLLSSLPANQVKRITWIFKAVENFTQDFSLYFFTFMVLHIVLDFVF